MLGAVLTIFVVYAFPELLALHTHHRTELADLGDCRLHCGVAVRLHAQFHDALGPSLAIGVLIDDAIVVRENIVRHMQMGSTGAPPRWQGHGNRPGRGRHHFLHHCGVHSGGIHARCSGEWFRPFALTVTCSVLVSLAISFTLDPMLSAFWGDHPTTTPHPRKAWGVLQRFKRLV